MGVINFQYQKEDIGKTLHFKFTSFNTFGQAEESIANVVDYSRTLDGGEARPPYTWQPGNNPFPSKGSLIIDYDSLGTLSTFSLTQTYQTNADGSATPLISLSGFMPANSSRLPPRLRCSRVRWCNQLLSLGLWERVSNSFWQWSV